MRETDILVERGSVNDAPSQTSGRANVEPASSNGSQGPNSNLTHGNDMRGGCDTVGQYVALDWEVFEGCLYTWPPAQYLQHVFDPRTCREIVQKEGAASVGFQWTDQATESRFSFHLRDKADSNLAYELYGVHIDIIDAGQSTCYRTISHNDGSVGKIPKGSRYCLSQAMVRPIQTRLGDVVGQAVKRSTRRGQEDRAGRALTDCIILNVYGDSSRFTRVDVIVDFIDVFGIAARFWPAQV
ncbi:hypothetical protein EDB80DRAFT_258194 [Ilyonectria destructans]|nr:hypothetical protein EDB80DRAFT_258194 [Ilyonectria destructans]